MKSPSLQPLESKYADAAQPILMSAVSDEGSEYVFVLLSNGQLANYEPMAGKWSLLPGNLFEDLIKETE